MRILNKNKNLNKIRFRRIPNKNPLLKHVKFLAERIYTVCIYKNRIPYKGTFLSQQNILGAYVTNIYRPPGSVYLFNNKYGKVLCR